MAGDDTPPVRGGPTPGGGWVPVPDPSTLTRDAVDRATEEYRRELEQLRELMETRIKCLEDKVNERQQVSARIRSEVEEKILHLRELTQEKFDSIDRRFDDRDARAADKAEAGEKALAAALQSAKELTELQNRANKELSVQQDKANQDAIAKAQGATNEKIIALEQVGSTSRQALSDKIDDARTRLTTMESLTRGIKEAGGEQREVRAERRLDAGVYVGIAGTVLALVAIAVTIIIATRH